VGDGISYNVNIYLSMLDTGTPVNELNQEALAVQEDGQKVEITSLHPLSDEPMNIVLVLDTSATMSETDMNNAKTAVSTFISRLKSNDQIAFITYDSSAKNQVDGLTTDHQQIVDIINNKTFATREAGTCFYDAAYSATKMFASQPAGSRAVILLTNGKDETANGAKCSDHAADEVIANASEGDLRTPIYVIGLDVDDKGEDGEKNVKTLQDFSDQTGGLYQNLSSSSKLANIFDTLSTQFRGQYILTYTSTLTPGNHTLIVSLDDTNLSAPLDSDSRKFSLQPQPPHIDFTSPQEGESVIDNLKITISLTTQGDAIVERVAFEVNGSKEGEDDTKPYEIELDVKKFPTGLMTISATAYGANNTELARSSINIIHAEITVPATVVPTEEDLQLPETPVPTVTPAGNNSSIIFMAMTLSGLSVAAIGVIIYFLIRQQKQSAIRELENYVGNNNTLSDVQGIPVYRKIEENQMMVNSDVLGTLTIEASDDTTLIGHRFEITTPLVSLGRSADNDVNFPIDKPVSRHHAEIYQISGKLYLREVNTVDASGAARPPKYGTFLNQIQMGSDPAQLKTGDEIQLGKRVRLKFESYERDMDDYSLTYDDDDDDRTATNDVDKTAIQD